MTCLGAKHLKFEGCSSTFSALQAATVLVAMASRKKIGDQNCQEGRQFGDLFPDHLICFNLHPDIIKSYDHKTVQCPLPS